MKNRLPQCSSVKLLPVCAAALLAAVNLATADVVMLYDAGSNGTTNSAVIDPANLPPEQQALNVGGNWLGPLNNTNPIVGFMTPDIDTNANSGLYNAWTFLTTNDVGSGSSCYYNETLGTTWKANARAWGWKLSARVRPDVLSNTNGTPVANPGIQFETWNFLTTSGGPNPRRYYVLVTGNTNNTATVSFGTGTRGGNTPGDVTVTNNGDYLLVEIARMNARYFTPANGSEGDLLTFVNGQYKGLWGGREGSAGDVDWGSEDPGPSRQCFNMIKLETMPPAAPLVLLDPQGVTTNAGSPVTFTAAFGPSITGVTWYKDGLALAHQPSPAFADTPNGGISTLLIGAASGGDIGDYACVGHNGFGDSPPTASAHLDVTGDVTAPSVYSNLVSSVQSRVRVYFSEPLDAGPAADPANYVFQGGALSVGSVTVLDPATVDVLVTTHPAQGSNYVLLLSNIKDAIGNTMAANTPVAVSTPNFPVVANLIAAFNQASASTNASGGFEWVDLSGNFNQAVNPSLAANRRPSLVPNSLQGHGVFNFDPANAQTLAIPGDQSFGFDRSNYTCAVVARCNNMGTGGSGSLTPTQPFVFRFLPPAADTVTVSEVALVFFTGDGRTTNQDGVTVEPGTDFFGRADNPANPGNQVHNFAHPMTNGEWCIILGHVETSNVFSRVLIPSSNTTIDAVQFDYLPPVGVGEFGAPARIAFAYDGLNATTPSWRFGGDLAEVLFYTGDLTASDYTSVMNYLQTKYFPPAISVRQNGTNVEVTYTGVLQSSTNVQTNYLDVPGNPANPYVITPGGQLPQQYFRARNP